MSDTNINHEFTRSTSFDLNNNNNTNMETLLSDIRENRTVPCNEWRIFLKQQINSIILQILSNSKYKPHNVPISAIMLDCNSSINDFRNLNPLVPNINKESSSEDIKGSTNNASTNSEADAKKDANGNNPALPKVQLGKLGKLINTQVFEFDDWDQIERTNTFKKPPGILAEMIELRKYIERLPERTDLDSLTVLSPFIHIIQSAETSGAVTGAALTSVQYILSNKVLADHSNNLITSIRELSVAVTNCKFEASEPSQDEIVLMKILKVMDVMVQTDIVFDRLATTHIHAIIDSALSLCHQIKMSLVFRHHAEQAIQSIILCVISKLVSNPQRHFNPAIEALAASDTLIVGADSSTRPSISRSNSVSDAHTAPTFAEVLQDIFKTLIALLDPYSLSHTDYMRLIGISLLHSIFLKDGYLLLREESLRPLICDKLMRNLWILQFGEHLNIVTQSLDLSTLLLSLGLPYMKAQLQLLINQAIQISSPNYQFGNIGKLKQDQIQFLFINFLFNLFQSSPTFFNELFINYDADIYHQNILEKLVNFIVENCVKYTTSEFPSQVSNIWLEQILKLLGSMLLRSQDKPQNTLLTRLTGINTYLNRIPPQLYQTDIPQSQNALYSTQTPEQILTNKANNQIITQAVDQFNTKPANGIDFLVQNNFLPSKDSENFNLELAKFIKNTPGLDKKKLGEYISKAQNIQILESFLSLFDFNNKRIDEAIRDFLTAFRLPGESQQIDRIMDTFSTYYFNSGPEEFNHRDAVYVISFSVVMLNTDQHSPQVRNKMDFNSYRNNLRGVNDGKNFSDEYLLAIFEGIRDNEIVMPEEHEGQKSLDFIWTSSLQNAQSSGLYYKTTPGQFDEQVFAAIYGIITDLLIQVYKGSLNDSLIQSCLMGLYLVGHLSNGFNNSQALDNLVKVVSSLMARLFSDNEDVDTGFSAQSSSIVNRTQMVDNIILSDLAVNLGQSYKAQLATVFLFNLSGDYIANLDSGWWDLLDLLKLFVDSFLLPTDLLTIEEYGFHEDPGSTTSQAKKTSIFIPFSAPDINIHNSNWKSSSETGYIHMQQPSVSTEGSNSGIFSALTSYLGYSSTHPDLIWELPVNLLFAYHDSTKKIIEPCKFKELMANIQNLNQSRFEALIKKLMIMTRLPQIDSNINDNISRPNVPLSESSDQVTDSSTEPLLQQSSNLDSSSAKYSPSSTFFIHWLVNIALEYHSADRFWPIILTFFADVIYQAEVYHPYIIQRVLVELVNIIFHLTPKSTQSNLAQLSLNKAVQLLGKTSPNSIISSSEQLVPAFKLLIATYSNFLFDSSCWATCLHVAHNTFSSPNPQTVHKTFNLVQQLIGSINHVQVSHGDYLLLVNLLIEYSNPDQFIRSSDDPLQLVIQRSSLSLRLIGKLLEQIPHVAQDRQLSGYYLPPMIGLSNLSNHLRKEIRGAALSQLKYALTSSYLTSQSTFADWSKIFHKVMFPLIDQTISNSHTSGKRQGQQHQQPQMDLIELEEGRTRVSSMLSQVYLVYLNLVSPINPSIDNEESLDSFTHVKNIWTELLPRVLKLMKHPRQNDQYFETIFEIVKNLILVMQATNILLLATDPALEGINTPGYQAKDLESLDQKTQLTITTYVLIKENFPQLMDQLFPARSLSSSPQNMLKIPTVSSENIGNQESVTQESENEVKAEAPGENKDVVTNEGDEKEATRTSEVNTPEPKQEHSAPEPAPSQQPPVQKEEPKKPSEDPDQIRDHSAASIILSL